MLPCCFSVKCCTGHQWRPLRALCSACDRHGYATGTWQGAPLCLSVSKNQTKRPSSRIRVSIQRRRPKCRDPGEATTEGGQPKRGTPTICSATSSRSFTPFFLFVLLRSMIPFYCSVAFCFSRALFLLSHVSFPLARFSRSRQSLSLDFLSSSLVLLRGPPTFKCDVFGLQTNNFWNTPLYRKPLSFTSLVRRMSVSRKLSISTQEQTRFAPR